MHVRAHTLTHIGGNAEVCKREHSIIIIQTEGGENNYYQIKTYGLQQKNGNRKL